MKTLHHSRFLSPSLLRGLLCLGLVLAVCGPPSLVPVAEAKSTVEAVPDAAAAALTRKKINNVKKQIKTAKRISSPTRKRAKKKRLRKKLKKLNRDLAAIPAPTPLPFMEFVTVGNAGNAADPEDGDSATGGVQNFGAVNYDFRIGKTEVTLDQYAAFLTAVAATDANGLYHASMGTDGTIKGIMQSGAPGSRTYTVIGSGKRPVTYVTWFDAARFCNWLHNGCPTGPQDATTTERGTYTLDGATSGVGYTRNPGAKYWIPSEDEWYKAAYHHPNGLGGPADHYYLYPTMSNALPGNIAGAVANQANFFTTVYSVTQSAGYLGTQNYLTDGGSYTGSASFYGTFDQGGNVWEWNDAVIGSFRGLRGGSWGNPESGLRSSGRSSGNPGVDGNNNNTFRVASPVPPPAAAKVPLIEMVMVGNAGNAADPDDGDQFASGVQNFGAVPYDFKIGKYEVSLDEYAAFLNAVAATDTYTLYNGNMEITQSAGPPFTYAPSASGKRPVTYVNWFDAARFCNWLHNGCPTGVQDARTTERGAYTLDGATSGLGFARSPGANYWIPSEDEWYKAAYHDPRTFASGGPLGDDHYWLFPTMSDSIPTPGAPPGGTNSANFDSSVGGVTDGGAYVNSPSYYGTFDQGGNVSEWNDAVIPGVSRGMRGGSEGGFESALRSLIRGSGVATLEFGWYGFRIASP